MYVPHGRPNSRQNWTKWSCVVVWVGTGDGFGTEIRGLPGGGGGGDFCQGYFGTLNDHFSTYWSEVLLVTIWPKILGAINGLPPEGYLREGEWQLHGSVTIFFRCWQPNKTFGHKTSPAPSPRVHLISPSIRFSPGNASIIQIYTIHEHLHQVAEGTPPPSGRVHTSTKW